MENSVDHEDQSEMGLPRLLRPVCCNIYIYSIFMILIFHQLFTLDLVRYIIKTGRNL